ncbi:hypothetical protein [Neptuniibacter sp. QD37_11]|uniref:hypothetical protein n=1 Tax=Neptuniibacter sp. QD37_11 TaxID=3398209 RepID=UPI0039F58549
MIYALKLKGKFQFDILAKSEAELEKKIKSYYLSWTGMQAKGGDTSMEKFMSIREKVKIHMELI